MDGGGGSGGASGGSGAASAATSSAPAPAMPDFALGMGRAGRALQAFGTAKAEYEAAWQAISLRACSELLELLKPSLTEMLSLFQTGPNLVTKLL